MKLYDEQDVANTRSMIAEMERVYEQIRNEPDELNPTAHKMVLASLQRRINRMKEDIVRYQSEMKRQGSQL